MSYSVLEFPVSSADKPSRFLNNRMIRATVKTTRAPTTEIKMILMTSRLNPEVSSDVAEELPADDTLGVGRTCITNVVQD